MLDDESFERIAAPARFQQVFVLETGFFASSAGESYWRSDDGRTWTEASDVPTGFYDRDTTNRGDDVYLSHSAEGIGYTSTDGGHTWSGPTMRPGESLTATDGGYFSVQPAVFGPGVGVVWVSSDDADWRRVVNPWPPLWTHRPVISGNTVLVPGAIDPPSGEPARLDLVGDVTDRATD